jgi:uncharacterized membrane protein YdjX (TVP38/TMEM64 family)
MRRVTRYRWIGAVVLAAALLALGRFVPFADGLAAFGAWIESLGPERFALYAAAYAVVTVLLLPAWLMTVAAGFLFGLLPGTAVVSAGSTVGAAAAFLIARHLARERVSRAAAKDPRFSALDRAIGEKGWKIVFLLRMSAVVPFVFSNYVYGLTSIRFWPYVAASWAGMIPLTLLYAALGATARRAGLAGLTGGAPEPSGWGMAILVAGILITAGVTIYVARITRKSLRRPPG